MALEPRSVFLGGMISQIGYNFAAPLYPYPNVNEKACTPESKNSI